MNNKISIIGGDLRIVKLASMLVDDGMEVYTYGLENSNEIQDNSKIKKCNNIKEVLGKSNTIIGPIPFSKDGVKINSPFSEDDIFINNIVINTERNESKIFIAGSINKNNINELTDSFKNVIDIMNYEEMVILNTIATAEGTIKIAIENTEKNIQGSKVLVLGFGRVGKIVAQRFNSLLANVTCAARKEKDLAWIETYGYRKININKLDSNLKEYDIIINTVPEVIINKKELRFMENNVLIIDLASKPGGINFEEAKKQKKKYIWALALPGKVSPVSTAEFIKNIIYNKI